MKFLLRFILLVITSALVTACVTVKPYQKVYLNDEEMQLIDRKVSVFGADFHAYREGAVGGTIGNSGSGCGCN